MKPRTRLALVAGIVAFLVFAGTGVSFAYWAATASTSGSVAVASPSTTNCVSPTRLVNGSFETPNISPNPYSQLATPVLGWSLANDNVIELWRGQGAVVPPTGAQLAELNGNGFGTLYQDAVTVPGQTLRWSVQHRGREGVDGMKVSINSAGGALVDVDQFTDPVGPWVLHTGAYVVPAGQTSTRISLTPTSTYQNNVSIGNLIDDVTFGSGPCLRATATVTNATTGLTSFRVGDTVEYVTTVTNTGGAPATPSTFSAVVPASLAYVAGSLQILGTARTDAASDDQAEYVPATKTISARIGTNATTATGGIVSTEAAVTVRYRATVLATPVGSSITFAPPTVGYADLFAPLWPLSTTGNSVAFTVSAGSSADVGVAVLASPTITASGSGSWTFRVTNNGPLAATAVSAALTLTTGPTYSAVTVTTTTGGAGTIPCTGSGTTRTCTIGGLPSGEGRTITVTGTFSGAPVGLFPVTATLTSTTFDYLTTNDSVVNNGIDGIVPTAPTGVTSASTTTTDTVLSWTASSDNVGVTGYRVLRNGVEVGTTTGATTLPVSGLSAGQPYWFTVQALDARGNVSAASVGHGVVAAFGTSAYRISWVSGATTRCLGASTNNNSANLQSVTCATADSQRWTLTTVATGLLRVSPVETATRGWNLENNDANDNTDVEVNSSNSTEGRARWIPEVVWDAGTSTAYLQFKNSTSSKCLDVTNGSTTTGAQVQQNPCTGVAQRRFTATVFP